MNHLDSLTPTLVLVTGALINHVCKENKQLTPRDVMLILSPTVPTLVPILVAMLKSAILAATAEKKKEKEDATAGATGAAAGATPSTSSLEAAAEPPPNASPSPWGWVWTILLTMWRPIANLLLALGLLSAGVTNESGDEQLEEQQGAVVSMFQIQSVKSSPEFIRQLSVYLNANRGNTCFYSIANLDQCYEIQNATQISLEQMWSNIRIQIPLVGVGGVEGGNTKTEVEVDVGEKDVYTAVQPNHVEIQLNDLHVQMTLQPNGQTKIASTTGLVEKGREVDLTKITRISDFIGNVDERKRFQALCSSAHEKEYLGSISSEYLQTAQYSKLSWVNGPYDIMMMELLRKEKCPNLDIQKSLVDCLVFSRIIAIGDVFSFGAGLRSFLLGLENIGTKIGRQEQTTLNLFGCMVTLDCTKNKVWTWRSGGTTTYMAATRPPSSICFFKFGKTEFPTLTAWVQQMFKSDNLPQSSAAPTRLIFTLPTPDICPAITSSFQAFLQSIQQGKYATHAGSLLDADSSTCTSKIKIFNMAIDHKEVRTETPNPAHAEYEEKRDQLAKLDKADNQTQFLTAEFVRQCQTIPPKMLVETKLEPHVVVEQVNEKSKRFDTLYLRELDMRKLHNILTKFKTSTELFETYGLPNKLGILLHGEPGTGKTSAIHAIATFLQKDIYYTNLSNVETNKELQMLFDHVQLCSTGGGIIVFEDIDAMTTVVHRRCPASGTGTGTDTSSVSGTSTPETQISRWSNGSSEKDKMDKNGLLTLEYLLNLLQGSLTRDGTIFIATTNYKEKLDPALCRVGRFDVDIEMKCCDHFQIQTIYKTFLQRLIPPALLRRIPEDQFTPAEFIFQCVQFIKMDDIPDETILEPFLEEKKEEEEQDKIDAAAAAPAACKLGKTW